MIYILMYLPVVAYSLGVAAFVVGAGALKWWLIALIFFTWSSRGAISMANQGMVAGDYSEGMVTFTIATHWLSMFALVTLSLWAIFT